MNVFVLFSKLNLRPHSVMYRVARDPDLGSRPAFPIFHDFSLPNVHPATVGSLHHVCTT